VNHDRPMAEEWTQQDAEGLIRGVCFFSREPVYDQDLHEELQRQNEAIPDWATFLDVLGDSPFAQMLTT
jgi:hypothetical protein